MLNRHNRNKMDPTRINNYNKFLSTLDQKSNLNEKEKNAIKILSEKFKDSTVKDSTVKDTTVKETELKDELDKILDKINNNFKTSEISSSSFTGQTPNDTCCVNNIDPNYYRDINNHKILYLIRPNINPLTPSKNKKTSEKPSEKPVEIRETINIEAEVNNINDILHDEDVNRFVKSYIRGQAKSSAKHILGNLYKNIYNPPQPETPPPQSHADEPTISIEKCF